MLSCTIPIFRATVKVLVPDSRSIRKIREESPNTAILERDGTGSG